jgi:hypothetical protein
MPALWRLIWKATLGTQADGQVHFDQCARCEHVHTVDGRLALGLNPH